MYGISHSSGATTAWKKKSENHPALFHSKLPKQTMTNSVSQPPWSWGEWMPKRGDSPHVNLLMDARAYKAIFVTLAGKKRIPQRQIKSSDYSWSWRIESRAWGLSQDTETPGSPDLYAWPTSLSWFLKNADPGSSTNLSSFSITFY